MPPHFRFEYGGAPVARSQEHDRPAAECLPVLVLLPRLRGAALAAWESAEAGESRRAGGRTEDFGAPFPTKGSRRSAPGGDQRSRAVWGPSLMMLGTNLLSLGPGLVIIGAKYGDTRTKVR